MNPTIVRITHEERGAVSEGTKHFTCRGPRHTEDDSTELGDAFLRDGLWAEADEQGTARTWVAVLDGEIVGYISLAADSIALTQAERRQVGVDSRKRYGCIQIVMLASHAATQERSDVKVGTALLEHAQLIGRQVGESIGARFLAAEVNPAAVAFYERAGFESLRAERYREDGRSTPMMLDLWPIASNGL